MGEHHENKVAFRKEIAVLIDSVRKEWEQVGSASTVTPAGLKHFTHMVAELHRMVAVYNYLENLPETKEPEQKAPAVTIKEVTPEKKEPVQEKPQPVVPPPPPPPPPVPEEKPEHVPGVHINMTHKMPEVPPATKKIQPDIKSFIGFNERIMFQRHLFNNDAAAYDRAITALNQVNSYSDASALLSRLGDEYHWNKESEPVQIFLSTVKRRFA